MATGVEADELWRRFGQTLRKVVGEGSLALFLALSVAVLLGELPSLVLLLAGPSALLWFIWPAFWKKVAPKRTLELDRRLERGYQQMRPALRVLRVLWAAEAFVTLILLALRARGQIQVD